VRTVRSVSHVEEARAQRFAAELLEGFTAHGAVVARTEEVGNAEAGALAV